MFTLKSFNVDNKIVVGLKVDVLNPPLLLIIGEKGVLSCGYFDLKTAAKFNVPVAIVRGVKNFEDMWDAEVQELTDSANRLGVVKGERGEEAIRKFSGVI
ncbi:MAG: DUF1805 domain-containing protein [Candidatus Odinarchaeum yellowstonii]|uniref:DUF1805 domain-containing protein n=1 Tax=Odinarchaeota yellowstonii (strain LCB_4) TaxID=1841599 RepID=A0AAF0IBQ1_ODILC|nr:MAG: DUF1805 domain-containing protein [Candidatus Odinarchaeum yellowstonii]